MKQFRFNMNFLRQLPTIGMIAYCSFIICVFSGVLLAIPYNINAPLDSIFIFQIKNQSAVFIRSIHYWSSQIFIIMTIIHIIDHLIKNSELKIKSGVWLRLTLLIPIIIYINLSGFLLKGDAESVQALNIFNNFIGSIPILGNEFIYLLIGNGKDLQIIYLHHIATATIIIWIISIEHSKIILPNFFKMLYVLPFILLISIIFIPHIENSNPLTIKGPWLLIGLQEIMFWNSSPLLILIIIVLLLIAFYYLKNLNYKYNKRIKIVFLILLILYSFFILIGLFFRGENWKFNLPWLIKTNDINFENLSFYSQIPDSLLKKEIPIIQGKREACLVCHAGMQGLSNSHKISSIGCTSCHLGNSNTLIKEYAHINMTLTPGNLSIADKTCGTANCHKHIYDRIKLTMMTTMSGIVAIDKFVFNESDSPDKNYNISNISYSPADKHLRGLCASCHLSQDKEKPETVNELSRGGGCSACHLNYEINSLSELNSNMKSSPKFHPEISLKIGNNSCFGCHSRSGRISTNYEGWHETQITKNEYLENQQKHNNFRLLDDGRVFVKRQEDVHFTKGLDCIDCHNSYELMGDGKKYFHEEEQVKVECTDCHFTKMPSLIKYSQMDSESQKITDINNEYNINRQYLTYRKTKYPILNIWFDNLEKPYLKTKNKGLIKELKKTLKECTNDIAGHSRLDCITCHTSWSPQCVGCHTEYNPNKLGWDNLTRKEVKGVWFEKSRDFNADEPTLGIKRVNDINGSFNEIITNFIPGMALTINKNDNKLIFKRLFAPSFSHTIITKSRTCQSCHTNPLALGYGKGELNYIINNKFGKWEFKPQYELNKYDNLPEDAWIPFLKNININNSTRTNVRAFNIDEQNRILLVGACLNCHSTNSAKVNKVFKNFQNYRKKISKKCILPN